MISTSFKEKLRSRSDLIFEVVLWTALVLTQWSSMRMFLSGERSLSHDNILCNFPVFINYFRDLAAGHLPIYNFFSRFGEPFVPLAAQMRLWDPFQTLIGLGLWSVVDDKVAVFNWTRNIVSLLQVLGIYLFFRPLAPTKFSKFILLDTLLFGSVFFGSFQQDGMLNQFLWVPWILWIWRANFLEGKSTFFRTFTLGLLVGCSFQSYFFVMLLFFLVVHTMLWWWTIATPYFVTHFRDYRLSMIAFLIATIPMGSVNVVSLMESASWKFPMRSPVEDKLLISAYYPKRAEVAADQPDSLSVDADRIKSVNAASKIWDYVFMFSPRANGGIARYQMGGQGDPTEGFLYFGLLPLLLGFWGIAFGRNREKIMWLNLLCLFFVMSLGQKGLLYLNLVRVLPLLGLVRNTHCLAIYFELAFIYFIVVGSGLFERKFKELLDA